MLISIYSIPMNVVTWHLRMESQLFYACQKNDLLPRVIVCVCVHNWTSLFCVKWLVRQGLILLSQSFFKSEVNPTLRILKLMLIFYLTCCCFALINGSYYNDLEDVLGKCLLKITSTSQGFHMILLLDRRGTPLYGSLTCLEMVANSITLYEIIHTLWGCLLGTLFRVFDLLQEGSFIS